MECAGRAQRRPGLRLAGFGGARGALAFWSETLRKSGPGRPGSWPGSWPGSTRADRDRCLDGSAKAGSPLRSAPALHNIDKGLAKPGLPHRSPQGEGGFMERDPAFQEANLRSQQANLRSGEPILRAPEVIWRQKVVIPRSQEVILRSGEQVPRGLHAQLVPRNGTLRQFNAIRRRGHAILRAAHAGYASGERIPVSWEGGSRRFNALSVSWDGVLRREHATCVGPTQCTDLVTGPNWGQS